VVDAVQRAAADHATAVVLQIDTPGGLDSSMREIIQAILASPVPVIGYVAPSGARAASAGTFILYACHVAAMAPGTNLGAATPVGLFGDFSSPDGNEPSATTPDKGGKLRPENAEAAKVTNDAVAYIQGLASLRGRNADWAEKAVREAASLPYDAALEAGVIDLVADDLSALVDKLNGRTVAMPDGPLKLDLAGAQLVRIQPDLRVRLMMALSDPNIAFILLLVGLYGLILEFSHPGIYAPGVVGAISLVMALFALSIIPVDFAGLALVLLDVPRCRQSRPKHLSVARSSCDPDGVAGAALLAAGANRVCANVEAVPRDPFRKGGVRCGGPDREDAAGNQRPVCRFQARIIVERVIIRSGESVGAVVDVEKNGVVAPCGLAYRCADVSDLHLDSRVRKAIAEHRRHVLSGPREEVRHDLRND
jgi:hypothetical protein